MSKQEYDPIDRSSDFLKSLRDLSGSEIATPENNTAPASSMTESNPNEIKELLKNLQIDNQLYLNVIKPRIEARAENSKAFNVAFSRFVALIIYTKQIENFFLILDSVIAKGIAETGLRKNKDTAIYHDAPHPAEVSKEVGALLKEFYLQDAHSEAVMSEIFVKLAETAAACHDIIQNQSTAEIPMRNEEQSAELCAKYITEGIESKFQLDIGRIIDTRDSDIVMKVIDDFKKLLPFIAYELIVPTTYLVKPYNIPLIYFIHQFEEVGENHGD